MRALSLFLSLTILIPTMAFGNWVIHYMPTEDPSDTRLTYILDIITLALNKSDPTAAIQFKPLPASISFARAIHELKRNTYPNYFTPGGANVEILGTENLIAVDFPLDHGLLSYRVCFVSPKAKEKVSVVENVEQLREFTIAQGQNWPDISILKANHFNVIEVPKYTSLFKMVVSNRTDLVCRGLNEIRREYIQFNKYQKLIYDETFVLVYTMPYKLYFNQASAPLVEKLEAGLELAHQDGSLDTLFRQRFAEDLQFVNLSKRKRFYLKSGYEGTFSEKYQHYLFDPATNKLRPH